MIPLEILPVRWLLRAAEATGSGGGTASPQGAEGVGISRTGNGGNEGVVYYILSCPYSPVSLASIIPSRQSLYVPSDPSCQYFCESRSRHICNGRRDTRGDREH